MYTLKPPSSPLPSSAYWMSLTVKFCSVLPASAPVTAEIFGERALFASLIRLSPAVGEVGSLVSPTCLVLCSALGLEKQ